MSIGMFFYLVDIATKIKILSFLIALFVLLPNIFLFLAADSTFDKQEKIEKLVVAKKYLKKSIMISLSFLMLIVVIPTRTTMYIIGGEKAVYSIIENQDNKEIINLIKKITVQKLQEIAKDGK